jgi:hypothetical protein
MTKEEGQQKETEAEEPDLTDWDTTDTTGEESEYEKKGLDLHRKAKK